MIITLALAVAVLFAAGVFLMLKRDLFHVTGGIILISNAANLFIMSAGLSRGQAPLYPLEAGQPVSDPLVQALTLTAIVITFGAVGVFLSLLHRIYSLHESIDLEALESTQFEDKPEPEFDRSC
ncbi:MAG: sodium:proton antiporter [Dehalococcoidales bacterium]|nr:sodium:proton antiporter [Dehalococcoidales bacterium]